MQIDQQRVQDLVDRPTESLNVEIKRWLSPDDLEGQAKIVRAALALRNRGGGYIIIGADDKTLLPDSNIPADGRQLYHIDKLQPLITKYASEPFEISIGFGKRDDKYIPVIAIPSGVTAPVAAKADLILPDGSKSVKYGAVYFRSLRSNGTISTTEAKAEDWREIAEICFTHREADFGAFFRRQLASVTSAQLSDLLTALRPVIAGSDKAPCDGARELLTDGAHRYEAAMKARIEAGDIDGKYLSYGTRSVALIIVGEVPPRSADREFLSLLAASNPQYTGWPAWADSRNFVEPANRPRHRDGAWESHIVSVGTSFFDEIDFMRMDPQGQFYLKRILEDDMTGTRGPQRPALPPLKYLDLTLTIYRVAEIIAVGLAFARAMGCPVESTALAFAFQWTKLANRETASWASPMRMILGRFRAHDDEATTCVEVPLETPAAAIAPYVGRATKDLFVKFDGFEVPQNVTEDLVRNMVERRMR